MKVPMMTDAKLPLIHKAPVEGLAIHVARTGLASAISAWLDRLSDGRIGVFAEAAPILGLIPASAKAHLGHLGPVAEEIVSPSLAHGDDRCVRIIDLCPSIWRTATRPRSTSRSGATRATCIRS
jgi:hypothetical protein